MLAWTPGQMIAAAQAWAFKHGHPPSADDWRNSTHEHPGSRNCQRVYGTWNSFMDAAGFDPRPAHAPESKWTRPAMEDALLRWIYAHGRTPRYRDWYAPSPEHPHTTVPQREYGSWNGFLRAAGYEPTQEKRRTVTA